MGKLLEAIVLAVGLGCCSPASYTQDVKKETIEAAVEREIRKNDAWVEEIVEQDYTNKERDAIVSLKKISKGQIKFRNELGLIPSTGSFDPEEKIVYIPETDGAERDEILDSIDHELSHALYKAVIGSKGYSGPSIAEIAEYCKKKTSSPEFENLKQQIKFTDIIMQGKTTLLQIRDYYGITMKKDIDGINSRVKLSEKKIIEWMNEEEKANHGKRVNKINESLAKKQDEYNALEDKLKSIIKDRGIEGKSSNELTQLSNEAEKVVNGFDEFYKRLVSEFSQYVTETHNLLDTIDNRAYEAEKAKLKKELESAKTEEQREEIRKKIELNEAIRTVEQASKSMSGMKEFLKVMKQVRAIVTTSSNTSHLNDILGSPDEVLARIVDSAASLYFGDFSINKFPVSEEDLQLLEKMKYNGKPIFSKMASKARLAMQMVKDGIAPDVVKKQLEYATSFEYKGQKFSWPESNFTIKGNLPYEK